MRICALHNEIKRAKFDVKSLQAVSRAAAYDNFDKKKSFSVNTKFHDLSVDQTFFR